MPVSYDRSALRAHWGVVAALAVAAAITGLAGSVDLFGIDLSPAVQKGVAATGGVLVAYVGMRVFRRHRSNDPAVWIDDDDLYLHIHPGRPVRLARAQVNRIDGVVTTSEAAQRLLVGAQHFRIHTTHTGLSALHLRVGSAPVEAPLEDVRDAIVAWHAN